MPRLDLCQLPVVAAPMAGGPSTPELVAAAAYAGSIGFLPAGYRTAEQFADDVAETRRRTDTFGVNVFVPDGGEVDRHAVLTYRDLVAPAAARVGVDLGEPRWDDDDGWAAKIDVLVRDPVPWVSFTFGLPDGDTVARLRRAGTRLLMTVTDVDEARAAAGLQPDGMVVQSSAAGGHRGTFDQRRVPDPAPLDDLVRGVVAVTGLPVIAAGGIGTSTDVADTLAAGADVVQLGTALLLADEAGTNATHRRALTVPTANTTTMRAFTGRVARGIRNAFSETYDAAAPAGYPAIHHVTSPLRRWAAAHDDSDNLHMWAGTGVRNAASGKAADLLTALVP